MPATKAKSATAKATKAKATTAKTETKSETKSERTNPTTGKAQASSFVTVAELAMLDGVRLTEDMAPRSGFYRVFVNEDGTFTAVGHVHDETCSAVHPQLKEAS